jgi:hypothetical protein
MAHRLLPLHPHNRSSNRFPSLPATVHHDILRALDYFQAARAPDDGSQTRLRSSAAPMRDGQSVQNHRQDVLELKLRSQLLKHAAARPEVVDGLRAWFGSYHGRFACARPGRRL